MRTTTRNAATAATPIDAREPLGAPAGATVRVVGVACGAGAPDPRCAAGPAALRRHGLISSLRQAGMDAAWSATIAPPPTGDTFTIVSRVAEALSARTEELVARGRVPVVLGGDHSCAIGTWKGVARGLAARSSAAAASARTSSDRSPSLRPPCASPRVASPETGAPAQPLDALGLVWIDAHMDAHTAQTSMSGKIHGMPLASLLGEGDPRLTGVAGGIRLDPRRVCLVGVRSFETGEAALLRRLGVRVYFMHDIERQGLPAVLNDAVAVANDGGAYGISLDLDAVDPRDAPGVGSPVAGGIRGPELLRALARHGRGPTLAGLEITEYNPDRDRDGQTARLVVSAIATLLAPRALSVVPA